jgi:hypothetical protein
MFKLSSRLVLGLPAVSALGLCSLFIASPVSAFVISQGAVTVGANDVNQSFDILFDGNVAEKSVSGLSSKATFTFLGFTTVGKNTEAAFKISLGNTSSSGISSRTSALGFDVDQSLLGIGSANKVGSTRVSGLFSNDREGSFPNQFGALDVCFTNGNNCQGGQNGGVTTGKFGEFLPTLAFSGNVSTFTLSNFGVRYQSINGGGFNGDSGTGEGLIMPPATPVQPVVEPAPVVVTPPVVEPAPVVVTPPVVELAPVIVTPPVVEPAPVIVTPPVVELAPVIVTPPVVELAPVVVTPPVVAPPSTPSPEAGSDPVSVPEPGAIAGLLATGLAVLGCRRKTSTDV